MMGLVAVLVAILVGGIPFGLIIVRLKTGKDVRDSGSGNIGATNVLRTSGTAAGLITLLLDAAKGLFAVWLADTLTHGDVFWMSATALAALLGHAFSPYLKFKGGKSVATFLGAFGYLTPIPVLIVTLIFILVVAMTRYLSLGSITGAALFPFACFIILHPEWPVLAAALGAALLILWRHSGNIARIRAGNERVLRFGKH
ncbi:MAG TPA: glycerol-3-phosphate 1-O-acyltransferase PlsY [Bryobacteraceae bacterium]|jgi:glycerol-3-phosphate acyltransferase PlsY|nr:glycerol-3-phosphate 1-O-acyltransferase PlsY [Bryobacteraceae bacterium]